MRKSPLLAILIIFFGLTILINILFFMRRSQHLSDLSDISNELVLYWSKVQLSTLNLLSSPDIEEASLLWAENLQKFKDDF